MISGKATLLFAAVFAFLSLLLSAFWADLFGRSIPFLGLVCIALLAFVVMCLLGLFASTQTFAIVIIAGFAFTAISIIINLFIK